MSVAVVAPVWNGRELLARLFDSLDAQTLRPDGIVAVDNGSTDGAPELARARGARVISLGRNLGFAPAVNRGIRECKAEWIAVLNTDVELAPDYLSTLREAAETAGAWFATGKILSAADPLRIDGTFDALCRGGAAWRVGHGRADGPVFSLSRPIASAPWTAALFRASLFERVGLLDETFGSYLEDVEFGVRCALAGLPGVYVPTATARHLGGASLGPWSAEMVRLLARNQLRLVARHYPRSYIRRNWWRLLVAQALWGALAIRRGAGLAWLRGIGQGLAGFEARTQGDTGPALDAFLRDNERTIHEIQVRSGFDLYWRMYFLLTGTEAK